MMAPKVIRRGNFRWLLIALIVMLFCDAIVNQLESPHGRLLVNVGLLFILFSTIWTLDSGQQGWRKWKYAMTVVIAGLMVGNALIDSKILAMGTQAGCFLYLCLSLYLVWKQVLFTGPVDTNKIIGSICIYILLGMVWAFGYLLTEAVFPGSFNGLNAEVWQTNLQQFIYYSMVTLTTVGYGDITPEQPVAHFLAYMEGVTGIFYTTILVASLLGVQLANKPTPVVAAAEPDS
ncbi:MAG: potassium channel family protein [Halioglobus sp.]